MNEDFSYRASYSSLTFRVLVFSFSALVTLINKECLFCFGLQCGWSYIAV